MEGIEEFLDKNDKRVIGSTKEIEEKTDIMDKKVDALMQMVIHSLKLQPVKEEDEQ